MNDVLSALSLFAAGLLAGFIDSIAGGGGLITLPVLTFFVGPGADAIGTNKIGGLIGACMALVVYTRKGHMDWGRSFVFAGWVAIGSFAGSRVAPLVPKPWFTYFLFISCPLILWIVYRREFWMEKEVSVHRRTGWKRLAEPGVVLSGLACGFYDGIWGPGGGTFMLLSLVFIGKLPLLSAMAASKLANTGSAGTALVSYSLGGWVHWKIGILIGAGMALGATIGANHGSRQAARAVRPVLVCVVLLLLLSLLRTTFL